MKIVTNSDSYVLAVKLAKDFDLIKDLSVKAIAEKYGTNMGNVSRVMSGVIAGMEIGLGERTLINLDEFQNIKESKRTKVTHKKITRTKYAI